MISPHEMPLQFNCVGVKQKETIIYTFILFIDVIVAIVAFYQ